jgi:hypothetical protein
MMIELTTEAKRCLDDYLGEMRTSLRGCPTVNNFDVERDVKEHIEKSLADAPTPVDSPALRAVLEQLGSPSQWIPEEDLPWKRKLRLGVHRVVKHLRSGPEDFRLAYLSIGLLVAAGFILPYDPDSPLMFMCACLSFLFSRAALATESDHQELGAQRWLLYPVLLLVYVPLAFTLLSWAAVIALPVGDELHERVEPLGQFSFEMVAAYASVTSTALWWFLLGLVLWRWPALVRNVFYPFVNGFRGRHGLILAAVGLLLLLGVLALGERSIPGGWRGLAGGWSG